MNFVIRHRRTNAILHEVEARSLYDAVVLLVKKGANLRGADLRGAYLSGTDLSGTDLSGADLRGAYLSGARLRGADLRGAYLSGTDLSDLLSSNSVISLLQLVNWGELPDDLTLEMMRHDAESCGIDKMTLWANGGDCPFSNGIRDYQFVEKRSLWIPGQPTMRGMKLLIALCNAVGIKTDGL